VIRSLDPSAGLFGDRAKCPSVLFHPGEPPPHGTPFMVGSSYNRRGAGGVAIAGLLMVWRAADVSGVGARLASLRHRRNGVRREAGQCSSALAAFPVCLIGLWERRAASVRPHLPFGIASSELLNYFGRSPLDVLCGNGE
jgi:hypothetical protein